MQSVYYTCASSQKTNGDEVVKVLLRMVKKILLEGSVHFSSTCVTVMVLKRCKVIWLCNFKPLEKAMIF